MPIELLLTVAGVAVIQSIFGVGMLLFGTPILLLLGYGFVDALGVLLPVSLTISTLQVLRHAQSIDRALLTRLLLYSVPLVMLFLALVTRVKVNVTPFVGGLLLFVALKSLFPGIDRWLRSIVHYERVYLMVLGAVHGMSNLGGSLLTVLIYSKQYPKEQTRVTAAASYASIALCQLLTLLWVGSEFNVATADKISLVQVGTVVFLLTEEMLYQHIDEAKYGQLFAVFMFISGIMLLLK
jgi:hypothetical protein